MARRRRTFMGLPARRHRKSPVAGNLGRMAAVGASGLAAVPIARRGLKAAGKGQEIMARSHEWVGRAGDALGVAGDVKDAVSSHSSTLGKAAGMVGAVRRLGKDGESTPKLAHLIEEHTDISVPRSVAYNQWTQMERFPSIVKGVDAVDQLRHDRTEWISQIGPVKRRWKAKIVEQVPDERIAWRSDSGPEHRGVVSFHSLDDDLTRVMIQMHYVPHGPLETVANKLRIQRRRVRRDLRLFKHFLELRGAETGGWRGEIGDGSKADSDEGHSAKRTNRSASSRASGTASSRPTTRTQSGRNSSNGNGNGKAAAARSRPTRTRQPAK